MADLFDPKLTPRECDDVMRRHAFGFVYENDAINGWKHGQNANDEGPAFVRLRRGTRMTDDELMTKPEG